MRARAIAGAAAVLTLMAAGLSPAPAGADGLPVPGGVDTTRQGVVSHTGAQRFLAIARGDETLVQRVATASGKVLAYAWIEGDFSVPGVTIGGDTDGLSASGDTLVLIRPRLGFPQRETAMVVVDPFTLRVRRRVTLDGDFSFDAISPDGRTAYVLEYPNSRNPLEYDLRTLDLVSGRLAPGALLPENEPGEEMRGFPLARVAGDEGRWQYTLYDGGATYAPRGEVGHPFVHAIDTVERRTLCIDVEWVHRREIAQADLELSEDGSAVLVTDGQGEVTGTIDTATGEASQGFDEAPVAASGTGGSGGGSDALAVVGAGALLAAMFALAVRFRRHRVSAGGSAS